MESIRDNILSILAQHEAELDALTLEKRNQVIGSLEEFVISLSDTKNVSDANLLYEKIRVLSGGVFRFVIPDGQILYDQYPGTCNGRLCSDIGALGFSMAGPPVFDPSSRELVLMLQLNVQSEK